MELGSFRVSNDALPDGETLRARIESDGYLFFRDLGDHTALGTVRGEILEICRRHGWVAPGTELREGFAAGPPYREGDPEYFAVYDDVQRLESFHALAHDAGLLEMLRTLFGEEVLVHPRNIARIMFPNNNHFTTPPHQDFIHIQGTPRTYTAWFPLGNCPNELGGLAVLAGSHRVGVLPLHKARGAGGVGVETDGLELSWVTGAFQQGDVLLFHSHTVHRALDNQTPDRLRLSVDYRYQPVSEPVTEGSLLPHFNRVTWDEIYAQWESDRYQYYWRKPDLQIVTPRPREELITRRCGEAVGE
jgi:hypothetical protein